MAIEDVYRTVWTNSALHRFQMPAFDGVEKDVSRLRLVAKEVAVVQSPDFPIFARQLLGKTSCRQLRVTLELEVDGSGCTPSGGKELEDELKKIFGRHWRGGYFDVLCEAPEAKPVIWLYGLGLATDSILNEVVAVLRQRQVPKAELVLDLDQLALAKGF